ncbi:unnamed protein product [Brassicogethes aeneus]|uniref:PH domain-containing protein n=1 Tax=Brassicogethes aeneus TaxID=1431903 RepID=A0A9P0BM38_BRAAE|nr:unnamed protein product [Brassicogethes aeneus]
MELDKDFNAKISGYLEKKGKMKVMSSYKKYWFVLEDRLLLYYRSKDEYESLYPYKGYINLGPPCSVKPCSSQSGAVFQLETRRSTITLRASDRDDQNRWMKALMSSLKPNVPSPAKLNHFRYSMDEITKPEVTVPQDVDVLKITENIPSPPETPNEYIIKKIQKMGAKSYTNSNNSINNDYQTYESTPKRHSFADNSQSFQLKFAQEKKSGSTGKLHLNSSVSHAAKSYFSRGSFKSLSMEKLPSIIIENDQYQPVNVQPGVNHKEFFITNDIYATNPLNYSEITFKSSENIYHEPKIDHNDNEMKTIYTSIQDTTVDPDIEDNQKKNKKKKKEKPLKPNKEKLTLIDRVFKLKIKKIKKDEDQQEENVYEEIPVPALSPTDQNTIQILHEVQHILEKKKEALKGKLSSGSDKMEINDIYETFDAIHTEPKEEYPEVPPKSQKQITLSPYHDVPKNNLPINKMILPPKRREMVSQKSVDEILEDLDKEQIVEQSTPRGKVKKLVKQFSTNTLPPTLEEVVMRHKRRSEVIPNRYSDELSILLEQLAQVTTAPLLQPGTTNSLISPNLTDDELLRLLPIRKRRFSEPDYDVPRPHRSLINIPRQDTESPIKATRFFGEVLSFERKDDNFSSPRYSSITPDSLESELNIKTHTHQPLKAVLSLDEDPSYSSHTYHQNQKNTHQLKKQRSLDIEQEMFVNSNRTFFDYNREYVVNNDVYAQPKKKNHLSINYKNLAVNDSEKVDFFVDSLEMNLESKTQF